MVDQNKLDALFVKAKSAPHTSVFNETKEQFLIASSDNVNKISSKKDQFITFNKGLIMLIIAVAIALTSFLLSSDIEEVKTESRIQTRVELNNELEKEITQNQKKKSVLDSRNKSAEIWGEEEFRGVLPHNDLVPISYPIKREIKRFKSSVNKEGPLKRKQDSEFVFPKLTEKEISDNNKRKKKMLKALNKKDKKVYSYIPSGSFTYNSKPVSVQAFHMQRNEVTNLEYKTFLFDLLIQDRKADFLIAKPKQELWTEELGKEYKFMQDDYFSGEDYEDCPVNNISRKGAELYCDWITLEANAIKMASDKVGKDIVRIPQRVEWMKAATAEGQFPDYPWTDSTSAFCFLSNISMKEFTRLTATMNRTKEKVPFGYKNAISTGEYVWGRGFVLNKSESYYASEYGLYNMCGNVAEMVYESVGSGDLFDRSKLKSGTAGGGWMNTQEEVKLSAEDLYQGIEEEHLNIGFRVVITHSSLIGVRGN